jgi:hypothetical protein
MDIMHDNRKSLRLRWSKALVDAFDTKDRITKDDIPRLLAVLHIEETTANMHLVATESTFNAIEAFYKVR